MTDEVPHRRIRFTERVKYAVRGITEATCSEQYLDSHALADAVEVQAGPLEADELLLVCKLMAGVLKIGVHGGRDEVLAYVRERFPEWPVTD